MCTPRLLHDLHPPAGAIPDVGLATAGREADLFPRHAPLERLAEGPDPPARSWVVWATAVLLPAVAWHRSRVHSGVVAGVVAVALLTSACGLVVAIRNRPPGRGTLAVAGVGAILTLLQSILA